MKLVIGKNCGPCDTLKTWLKDQDIEVEQIVVQDNKDFVTSLNIRSVPTLVLSDDSLIVGLDPIKEYFMDQKKDS